MSESLDNGQKRRTICRARAAVVDQFPPPISRIALHDLVRGLLLHGRCEVPPHHYPKEKEMNRVTSVTRIVPSVFACLVGVSLLTPATHASTTLENMQAAFNGESNAHARYLAFASQADKEGYGEVASLFRAAARAEEIHTANHSAVMKEMGGTPNAKIETPKVKSTRENLEAAIKGESYERDTMYPEFLKQARADKNKAAIKSLNFAKTAEEEHAKLYTAALSGLDGMKNTKAITYYVCPKCGFTARNVSFEKCPSCFTPKEQFEKVA
jgi:rubrerythrin